MATPGTYISVGGHIALVVWLVAGWGFESEPLPFDVSEVSVVSGEEYAALVAATTPQPGAEPDSPVAPVIDAAPTAPVQEPDQVTPPTPEAVTPPAAELPPPPPPEPLAPVNNITDTAPVVPGPPADEVVAAPNLTESLRPTPRPVERVAPDQVAPPPPEAEVAPDVQQAATPDAPADAPVVQEATEETAPEEAATEIVTEAETPSGIVTQSPRPRTRPERPAPAPTPEPEAPSEAPTERVEVDPEPTVDDAAVAAALAAATAAPAPAPDIPQGPPMTGSEQEGFRVAVNRCWNVDPGSQAARVTMTVGFELDQGGRVVGDVRQISATGGDGGATQIAFDAARRAILRCQGPNGYDLPPDKYGQWREVEITFDPSGMRLR